MQIKNILPLLVLIFLYSFGSGQTSEFQKIEINTDSCRVWQLPNVNVSVQIPSDYMITYNSSGGFYFQAHKRINGKLICEISFGSINGEIETLDLIDVLARADGEIRNQIEQVDQIYKTRFIGNDSIGGLLIPQLRNYIEFKDFDSNFDGKFNGLVFPVILDNENKFMFSSMLQIDQTFNDKLIGFDIIRIVKSIKIKQK
jgi:hypothetical protein